ncbi:MAG: asparagine synthase (glutamine-hydrolyzing) [Thermodesulfobacteriota bacterium]|nr:asparagine synthase (glutamine-hydrolyzing) [Thermodesulfobacteriota bacterium]
MCGICGFFGQGDESLLDSMNKILSHRGPDDSGLWIDPVFKVGLGITRLAVIDLVTGNQPVFNEDQSIVCVFNGEIYNYKKLRQELIRKGHTFSSDSDSEVLVHGYEEYCQDLPMYLHGMFAFAIYDRISKTLFCARDRFGIKPFYYLRQDNIFYFASEQKAILCIPKFSPEINRRSIMRHLIIGFYTGPFSLFRGIHQLPPGHCLTLSDGKMQMKQYWELSHINEKRILSEDEATETLKAALAKAIKEHLVSDVLVGLTLSGGLDSSILAYLMTMESIGSQSYSKPHAFTVGYAHQTDEIPFARMVSNQLPITAHERICNIEEVIQNLPRIVWHLEEPLSNVTALTAYEWAKFISETLKVTLVGEGADEILGGYFQYRLFSGWMGLIPSFLTRRLFRFAFLQPTLQLIIKLMRGTQDIVKEAKEVFHDEYLTPFSNDSNSLRGALRFDMEYELSNNQLLRVDRMSMAHGLEARVPYLDHRFVETLWAMPEQWKIQGTKQKYIIRKIFKNILPDAVVNRPKIGAGGSQPLFPLFFDAGMENEIARILTNTNNPAMEWFDPGIISELIQKREGVYPLLGTRIRDKLLYAILMFVIWHQLFMDKRLMERSDIPKLGEIFPE